MAAARFVERLNEQIAYEFAASQQYVANAVYYDAQTLPRLAAFFYAQAVEERNHAMMMVQYLLDADAQVTIPAVTAPETEFDDVVAPVALALEQERRVSDQIAALTEVARDEGDYLSEQFVQWFLKEQVEEVASMSSLLAVVAALERQPDADRGLPRPRALQRRGRRSDCAAGGGGSALALQALRRTTCSSPRRIVTFDASRCSSSAWANLREVPSSSRSWASVTAPPCSAASAITRRRMSASTSG